MKHHSRRRRRHRGVQVGRAGAPADAAGAPGAGGDDRGAQEFVRPLTFAALTGRKVLTDLFAIESAIEHIGVAQENDLLVVAPATADLLAKLAHGLADDFLTTLYLAFTGPVVLAPAMNVNMWQHAATQANLETLRRRGHRIVEPAAAIWPAA
jgi:phosphopantothenoylcysteine decarboxylase / phosphopantothenate---cysteine ligase